MVKVEQHQGYLYIEEGFLNVLHSKRLGIFWFIVLCEGVLANLILQPKKDNLGLYFIFLKTSASLNAPFPNGGSRWHKKVKENFIPEINTAEKWSEKSG